MKTKLILAAAAAFVTAPALAQTLPPPVVIVVDMDRVVNDSAAGKQATAELKTRNDALQARVNQLRTQFGTEEQTLGKSQPAQGAAPAAVTAWETKARDYQQRRQAAEADVQKRIQDLQLSQRYVLKQINDGTTPIVTAVMRERGATIVLPENATLQHAASLDVTTDVIARLDKALPRVSTTAPAAAPAK
ncbi:MAG: OmpH family outer membrane protein [Sphingomonadaceae bacterium]|nr:OmpH family outer membrane protein [Sphingomonadaceae bacterium]